MDFVKQIGNISDSGTCGDNLTWNLTDDGVLYIIGTGQMDEIKWGTNWQNNFTTQMITSIVIGDGVESISKRAFARCSNLTEVSIGKGVTNIDTVYASEPYFDAVSDGKGGIVGSGCTNWCSFKASKAKN